MSQKNSGDIVNVLDLRILKDTIKSIKNDEDNSLDAGVREAVSKLEESPSRETLRRWLSEQSEEVAEKIGSLFVERKKKSILRKRQRKLRYMGDFESPSIDTIASYLSLTDICYFDSYFKFANRTMTVHKMKRCEGIFGEIDSNSDSPQEARDLFKRKVRERSDISNRYAEAAEEIPSALISEVDVEPRPRLIKFEDSSRIYMEFWSVKGKESFYDVNRGDYVTIERRAKTAVRFHLDSNVIEYASTDDSKNHRSATLNTALEKLAFPQETRTDGGLSAFSETGDKLYSDITIKDVDVKTVKENIGILSTLDAFRGQSTNSRVTARDNTSVESDPIHPQLEKGRPYRKSHPQIILGQKDGEWELLDPSEIDDDFDFDDDISIEEIVDELREKTDYDRIRKFTVVLHIDNDTIRIWKENSEPDVRHLVFSLIVDELGW